jgi:L,D-transpeptidase catalytic domain/Bacterial Ig-like domain
VFGLWRPGKRPADKAADSASDSARTKDGGATAEADGHRTTARQDRGGAPFSRNGDHPEGARNGRAKAAAGGGDGSARADGTGTGGRRPSGRVIAIGAAAVCVAGAGIGYAVSQAGSTSSQQSSPAPIATGPEHLVSTTPVAGATDVDGANPLMVTFTEPPAPNTPMPRLTPSVPGTWNVQGDSLVFSPQSAFTPNQKETLVIPGGRNGVRSNGGGLLATSETMHFTTGAYSQQRLAEILSQLGYLPFNWAPQIVSVGRIGVQEQGTQQAGTQQAMAYNPPAGTYTMQPGYPSSLAAQWSPSQPNVVLRGAVMAFQSEHHMTINGDLTPRLWNALFRAEQSQNRNANGYSYAVANKGSPETLTIWHNGHVVLTSLTNTGIPVSPTVDGTFPVYLRMPFQIMQGTNPDGSSYADPVWWVSYFNGGDAVHYFPRGSYGFQQSLGCVELPWNDAKRAYPFLTYGSLVTVQG